MTAEVRRASTQADGARLTLVPAIVKVLSSYVAGFLVARGYAPRSARQRSWILRQFIEAVGDIPPADVTAEQCLSWWSTISTAPKWSQRSHMSAVRTFYAHLRELGAVTADPTSIIRKPTAPRSDPQTLTVEEVAELLTFCAGSTRDTAMVKLMLGCGFRCLDVANLRRRDVDFTGGVLTVVGKGGHEDTLPMPAAVSEALTEYLAEHPGRDGLMFLLVDGSGPVTPERIELYVRSLLMRAGVKRESFDRRGPHSLRRTYATTLLEAGATIRQVQVLMRHSTLATTEVYLRRPDAAGMRSVVELGPLAGES